MTMTNHDLEQAIEGVIKFAYRQSGEIIPLELNQTEKILFKNFCEQGFAIKRGRVNLFYAYSKWCSINNEPQIYFQKKSKYNYIEFDMVFTKHKLSEKALSGVSNVFKEYSVLLKNGYINGHIGEFFSYCKWIPDENIEIVAKKLAEIVHDKNNWIMEYHP